MVMFGRASILSVMVLGAAACGDDGGAFHDAAVFDDAPGDTGPGEVIARRLDLLFVIDNAPSMLDKETALLNNLPNFINVLQAMQGGLPNIHIGVITPDLGTRGALDVTPAPMIGGGGPGSCASNGQAGEMRTDPSVDGHFIVDVALTDGTRRRNYTGTLAEAFNRLASVGTQGCGFEQPLEAAKLALSSQTANAGFLRSGAQLAIVIIDDEDDCSVAHTTFFDTDTTTLGPLQNFRCNRFGHVCSTGGTDSSQMNMVGTKDGCTSNESSAYLTHVGDYVTFFKGLESDPTNVIIGIIDAPPTPYAVELRSPPGGGTATPAVAHSCSYADGIGTEVGDPAVRLVQFANAFPNRSTFSTICQQDWSGPIVQITDLLSTLWM
jgi:hypothetical protein